MSHLAPSLPTEAAPTIVLDDDLSRRAYKIHDQSTQEHRRAAQEHQVQREAILAQCRKEGFDREAALKALPPLQEPLGWSDSVKLALEQRNAAAAAPPAPAAPATDPVS